MAIETGLSTKGSKSSLGKAIRKSVGNYLLLLPFTVFFVIFTVFAVVSAIGFSFTNYNMIETPQFVGISNYIRMFANDPVFLIVVKNTFIFALITGPISYFLCLFVAWLINDMPKFLRTLLTFVFYAPSISGSVYIIWSYIFSGDVYGLANGLLMKIGFINEPILWMSDSKYVLGIIIVVQLWTSLGTSFLAFIAGLKGVDTALYESGAIDGIRNRFAELRYITLPSMGPQLMFAAVMQIGASFAVSAICMQLAGFPSTDYAADTIVTHIQDHALLRYEMGYACAQATVLFIVMITFNNVIKKFLSKKTNI